jgi:hypothetical protein
MIFCKLFCELSRPSMAAWPPPAHRPRSIHIHYCHLGFHEWRPCINVVYVHSPYSEYLLLCLPACAVALLQALTTATRRHLCLHVAASARTAARRRAGMAPMAFSLDCPCRLRLPCPAAAHITGQRRSLITLLLFNYRKWACRQWSSTYDKCRPSNLGVFGSRS